MGPNTGASATAGSEHLSFVDFLQHGAIVSAGGGYTETILECLHYTNALAFRQASRDCRDVVSRGWHGVWYALWSGRYLSAALKCFPAVRELEIEGELVRHASESEWLRLIDSGCMAQLRKISFTGFLPECGYTDRWVSAVCTRLPRLTHLDVKLAARMTSQTLFILADAERLTVLDVELSGRNDVSTAAVAALLQRWRALRTLAVGYRMAHSESVFAHAAECSALRTLILAESRGLSAQSLEYLSVAPALTHLNLHGCDWLCDAGLAHLERCATLTQLNVALCNRGPNAFTTVGLASLGRLPVLREVNMNGCTQRAITDAGFSGLALDMSECCQDTITDAALVHLARCATLTSLRLDGCTQSGCSGAQQVRAVWRAAARCATWTRSTRHLGRTPRC
jgi:hypothetical protein